MTIELGRYRHYKGGMVEVIGLGRHSETLEEMVLYRELTDNPDFARTHFGSDRPRCFLRQLNGME